MPFMPGLLKLLCSAAPLMDSLDVNNTCKRLIVVFLFFYLFIYLFLFNDNLAQAVA